jgi:hypothetical protein
MLSALADLFQIAAIAFYLCLKYATPKAALPWTISPESVVHVPTGMFSKSFITELLM